MMHVFVLRISVILFVECNEWQAQSTNYVTQQEKPHESLQRLNNILADIENKIQNSNKNLFRRVDHNNITNEQRLMDYRITRKWSPMQSAAYKPIFRRQMIKDPDISKTAQDLQKTNIPEIYYNMTTKETVKHGIPNEIRPYVKDTVDQWLINISNSVSPQIFVTLANKIDTTAIVFSRDLKKEDPGELRKNPYRSGQLQMHPWQKIEAVVPPSPIPYNVHLENELQPHFSTNVTAQNTFAVNFSIFSVQDAVTQWPNNITVGSKKQDANVQQFKTTQMYNIKDKSTEGTKVKPAIIVTQKLSTSSQIFNAKTSNQTFMSSREFTKPIATTRYMMKYNIRTTTEFIDLTRVGKDKGQNKKNTSTDQIIYNTDDPFGIELAYSDGNFESFDLKKHLENEDLKLGTTEVPLSPIDKLKMDVATLLGEKDPSSPKVVRVAELYHDKQQRKVGYLTIALTRVLELLTNAPDELCHEFFQASVDVVTNLNFNKTLDILGEPAKPALMNIVKLMATEGVFTPSEFRDAATYLLSMLVNKQAHFEPKVLNIVTDAEALYNDDEGLNLFVKVAEFYDWIYSYYSTNSTTVGAIQGVSEAVLAPVVRLHGTLQLQKFLIAFTHLLENELPHQLITAARRRAAQNSKIYLKFSTSTGRKRNRTATKNKHRFRRLKIDFQRSEFRHPHQRNYRHGFNIIHQIKHNPNENYDKHKIHPRRKQLKQNHHDIFAGLNSDFKYEIEMTKRRNARRRIKTNTSQAYPARYNHLNRTRKSIQHATASLILNSYKKNQKIIYVPSFSFEEKKFKVNFDGTLRFDTKSIYRERGGQMLFTKRPINYKKKAPKNKTNCIVNPYLQK